MFTSYNYTDVDKVMIKMSIESVCTGTVLFIVGLVLTLITIIIDKELVMIGLVFTVPFMTIGLVMAIGDIVSLKDYFESHETEVIYDIEIVFED